MYGSGNSLFSKASGAKVQYQLQVPATLAAGAMFYGALWCSCSRGKNLPELARRWYLSIKCPKVFGWNI